MPWMRVSIGVGAVAVVAGVCGMILWIHDGSHFFDLAVAVAMAGFLTLISCVLTRVFGSSHGTQDDAFRRGRSMGYDAGFLEGHRTARPVVVPLHLVGRAPALVGRDPALVARDNDSDSDSVSDSDIDSHRSDEQDTRVPSAPMWRRDGGEGVDWWDRWDRGSVWVRGRRTPLLVGALALGVIGVLTASMMLPTSASTVTARPLPGTLFNGDAPRLPATPALVAKLRARPAVATITRLSPLAPPVAAGVAAVPAAAVLADTAVAAAPASTAVAAVRAPSSPKSTPGTGVAAPVTAYLPAVSSPVTVPVVVPAPAAPVVALTAAEQTAANAKAAADLTAANAAAAAAETARVAAAAAEATRLQAIADAYAVAHPAG